MAIKYVANVTHNVRDQETALDFFVNKCGFEKRQDASFNDGQTDMRWLEVAPPGSQTVIMLAGPGYGGEDQIGGFANMVLWADDIQSTCDTMVANGVEFVEPPTAQPWGMIQAIFKDQDGTSIVLVGSNQ